MKLKTLMDQKSFLKVILLVFVISLHLLGTWSCNSASTIEVSVEGVGAMVAGPVVCEDNLYAVAYEDFNERSGESQVKLTDQGGGVWSGTVTVPEGSTDVPVFIYCDVSTGDQNYDSDVPTEMLGDFFALGAGGTAYTNTATFNACDRNTGDPTSDHYASYDYSITTFTYLGDPVFDYFGGSAFDIYNSPANYVSSHFLNDPYTTTDDPGAVAGDFFTTVVADAGEAVSVNVTTDFAFLDDKNESDPYSPGRLSEWCNCLAGLDHYLTYVQYFNYGPYTYYWGSPYYYTISSIYYRVFDAWNHFSSVGYFTDTSRTTTGGNCILP